MQVAEAIRAALGVHVTIVDHTFEKIITTRDESLGRIDEGSANALSLKTGELLFIDQPRNHVACAACGNKNSCKEFAEICAPIVSKDGILGVIGLVAYDESQRDYLIAHSEGVKKFVGEMAKLIASKYRETLDHHALEVASRELDLLVSHMEQGVVYTDCKGVIKRLNDYVENAFGFTVGSTVPADFLAAAENSDLSHQSFVISEPNMTRGIFDRHTIKNATGECGYVFFIETLKSSISRYHALESQPMLTHFDTIEGSSKAIRSAINIAMRAAMSSSTVLIQGESGTGKELFARAIHNHSARADCAFVAINCGAIPENLLESELFGYESGAFTGANTKGKPGKFELADGGTLFLDEIGDMPLNLQVKLLRVLQERAVERLGSSEPTPIDVRIICATHRDLELMVKEGEFREDLYYRIQVLPVMIPPLRERTEDIPDLVKQLVKRKKDRLSIGRNITVSDEVMKMFMTHRWTGNIRELENVIEYSLNIDTDGIVTSEDLPNRFYGQGSRRKSDRGFMTLQQMEHDLIKSAISHYGTHKEGIVQICNVLGISRATLYRKMKEV